METLVCGHLSMTLINASRPQGQKRQNMDYIYILYTKNLRTNNGDTMIYSHFTMRTRLGYNCIGLEPV